MAERRGRRVVLSLAVGALGAVAILVAAYVLVVFVTGAAPQRLRSTTVCRQPASIDYEPGGRYAVFAHEPTWLMSMSHGRRTVSVGHDSSYGVVIEVNSYTELETITCEWSRSGVTIVEPSEITHFVPAEVFTRN